jgi:restriction system protein
VPIPDYETIMLPLLKLASGGNEHSAKETIEALSHHFTLTNEEKNKLYLTKKVSIFYDRTHWALTYLKHAGLLIGTRRGFFKITERGKQVLTKNPSKIDDNYLKQFPEFIEFQKAKRKEGKQDSKENETIIQQNSTPWELLESSYKIIQEELGIQLLNQVKKCTPEFFERLVVQLLVEMGYGGTIEEAGQAIGRQGDEGIDGVIKEDVLGLDVLYIQAKKWDGVIGRPEIQKFAGALQGQRAKKGIFITIGNFSREAKEYTNKIDSKIVLVDGKQLTEYMIDKNIGVTLEKSYYIKKLDQDYFEETIE